MRLLLGIVLAAGVLCAQQGPRGHWSGVIEVPEHPLTVEIDLDLAAGSWIGSVSIPEQDVSGVELENIAFILPGRWTFRMKGSPGLPTFTGMIAPDGKSMSGTFTQNKNSMPFKLLRTGDAQVELPKSSPAVTNEFLGAWHGQLGPSLHFILKMANDESGAKGVLVNVEQDSDIPITAVQQTGTKLDLAINMVGAEYKGTINKEGTFMTGYWIQGGRPTPLNFVKVRN